MREQEMVGCGDGCVRLDPTGSVLAGAIPVIRNDVRLVDRGEVTDAISQPARDDGGVVREGMGGGAIGPPTGILKRLRKIPVVEGRVWSDAAGQQLVDETIVEVQPRRIDRTSSRRDHAGPGHGEAVRRQTEVGHERVNGYEVWSYRYDAAFCKWFQVGLDSTTGKVVDTGYGPDPLCDEYQTSEAESFSIMPAHHAKIPLLVVANASYSQAMAALCA